MKSSFVFPLIFSFLLAACGGPAHVQQAAPVSAGISYQAFYDELGPYGRWIDYPGYGYVWMPATAGFRPYATNGYWAYTSMGWTWVSNYSWGWAPFHYGRWFYEEGYGWMWLPGNEWAPAWVSWRTGGGMYGWAPLGPQLRVGLSFSWYDPPPAYWSFVPNQYVTSHNLNNYYINETKNVTIVKNTTIINNNYYGAGSPAMGGGGNGQQGGYRAGPQKAEVEKITHVTVTPLALREGNKPADAQEANGQLLLYRPRVNAAAGSERKPAPLHAESFRPLKPAVASERQEPAGPGRNANLPTHAQEKAGLNGATVSGRDAGAQQAAPAKTGPAPKTPGTRNTGDSRVSNSNVQPQPAAPQGNPSRVRVPAARPAMEPMPPAGAGKKNSGTREKRKKKEE